MENNDTICSVCLEEFDDNVHCPHVLACGHSFCTFCLANLRNAVYAPRMVITCPMCQDTKAYQDRVPVNYNLKNLCKGLQGTKQCDDCAKKQAVEMMMVCREDDCASKNVCAKCAFARHRDHDVVSFEELELQEKILARKSTMEDHCLETKRATAELSIAISRLQLWSGALPDEKSKELAFYDTIIEKIGGLNEFSLRSAAHIKENLTDFLPRIKGHVYLNFIVGKVVIDLDYYDCPQLTQAFLVLLKDEQALQYDKTAEEDHYISFKGKILPVDWEVNLDKEKDERNEWGIAVDELGNSLVITRKHGNRFFGRVVEGSDLLFNSTDLHDLVNYGTQMEHREQS